MNKTTFDFGMYDETFSIEDVKDHGLIFLTWATWKSAILATFLAVCAALAICGKSMIINYIVNHAPQERPINRMILVDTVS